MLVASLSLCKWLNELKAGAVRVSTALCTYGCIREIFESRYFRGDPNDFADATDDADTVVDDDDDDGAAATANVHIKNTEL